MPDDLNRPPEDSRTEEGGEWQLLLSRLSGWVDSVDPARLWDQSQQPLRLVAGLLAVLILLKVYGALLETIASVPLLGGLLELAGLVWLTRFAFGHLLRRDDRNQTLASLAERWRRFRGQS